MIDDGETDRKLAGDIFHFLAKNCTAVSVPHPRRAHPERAAKANRGKGICSAILQGFSTIAREAPAAKFTLKLDTDALVIGPFVEKLNAVIEKNPHAGMIGAYDHTPSGSPRDVSKNAATVRELHRPASIVSRTKNLISQNERAKISRIISAALANGYQFGEHCLGGAYAVTGEFLSRMLAAGYLDDPSLWLPIDSPEDVMIGIYTKAVGLGYQSFVERGEVFGVRHRGLDDSPQGLLDRGYSVIHAIKNDANLSEDQIREFFRARRETMTNDQTRNPNE